MPITTSAKKALRKDKRRTIINKRLRQRVSSAVKKAKKQPTEKSLSFSFSILDKAAKKKIIHKNKASRLKSRLAKMLKLVAPKTKTPKKRTKKA